MEDSILSNNIMLDWKKKQKLVTLPLLFNKLLKNKFMIQSNKGTLQYSLSLFLLIESSLLILTTQHKNNIKIDDLRIKYKRINNQWIYIEPLFF